MIINADIHLHGPFAGGTSKNMSIEKIAEMAYYKGLQMVSPGDLTHKQWLEDVFAKLKNEQETFFYETNTIFGKKKTFFLLTTEIEDKDRVHHLILFPDKKSILNFRNKIKPFVVSLDGPMDGRPKLKISSEKIARICHELGLFFGPAHAFTPYFGIYAHFDSIFSAYVETENLLFLELGLSADSYLANNIKELKNIVFLSNSDAHSFWPNKLGREFNRIEVKEPNFYGIVEALKKKRVLLNVGLDPKEGKYHRSACNKCYKIYTLEEAKKRNWKCDCGGIIKKGVYDRIMELANNNEEQYERPPYKHILPLSEIISFAFGLKNPFSKKVQDAWWTLIKNFDNEINVLIDEPIEHIKEINERIAPYINAFRKGWVVYKPGGGGKYGQPIITFSEKEKKAVEKQIFEEIFMKKEKQKTITDFL